MRAIPSLAASALALCTAAACLPATAQDDGGSGRQDEEILGGTAAFDLEQRPSETIWIDDGIPLFSAPDVDASRLDVIDALNEFEILDRSGDWYKVRYRDRLGWVRPDLPWKDRVVEVRPNLDPLSVDTPDVDVGMLGHIQLIGQLLGSGGSRGWLGPYELLTDVDDAELLDWLDAIATQLDGYYRERLGLPLAAPAGQTVAIFSLEDDYRRFEEQTTDKPRASRQGHTIGSVATLFVGELSRSEVRSLLVHELTHLINRRGLGPEPPAWLEEGIANDLAFCQADRDGRLRPATLDGSAAVIGTPRGRHAVLSGGVASLSRLVRTRQRRQGTSLRQLVELERSEFMASERRQLHYIEAAFLARFLLDGQRSDWAEGFRRYLSEVAAGQSPDADGLAELLGAPWAEVEAGFDAWLRILSLQHLR